MGVNRKVKDISGMEWIKLGSMPDMTIEERGYMFKKAKETRYFFGGFGHATRMENVFEESSIFSGTMGNPFYEKTHIIEELTVDLRTGDIYGKVWFNPRAKKGKDLMYLYRHGLVKPVMAVETKNDWNGPSPPYVTRKIQRFNFGYDENTYYKAIILDLDMKWVEGLTWPSQGRKLRAQWTPELAQELVAYHNIDAERELTALMNQTLAEEIDREVVRGLREINRDAFLPGI